MKKLIFLLLLILIPGLALAQTPVTQYVDWSTGCGGNDGTVGNPYCTCVEWEAQNLDLVSLSQVLTVEFIGTGSVSTTCTLAGWTTNSTRSILLNNLNMTSTVYSGGVLNVQVPNVTLREATLIKDGATDTTILSVSSAAVANFTLERSIISHAAGYSRDAGLNMVAIGSAVGASVTIRNNIFYDYKHSAGAALYFGLDVTSTYNINNNTVANSSGVGIQTAVDAGAAIGTTINFYNNISTLNTGNDYTLSNGSATFNSDKNISEDTTSPNAAYRSKTITFIDEPNNDYHLNTAESDAIDLADTIGSFANDYDNDARPQGSAWDIGADEVAATPTPTPTPSVTARKGQKCAEIKGQCLQ